MTDSNKRCFIWGTVMSVLLVYGILFFVTQDLRQPDLKGMLKLVPTTVTIELLLYAIFVKWGWKLKILHPWFVVTPDFSGIWEGEIHYKWNDLENVRSTQMKIIQSFNHITVLLSTEESNSRSVTASFDIDEKRGIYSLYYTYVNEPLICIQDRSSIHYGTTRFQFDPDNNTVLNGEYWTSRDTKGTIQLHKKKK